MKIISIKMCVIPDHFMNTIVIIVHIHPIINPSIQWYTVRISNPGGIHFVWNVSEEEMIRLDI